MKVKVYCAATFEVEIPDELKHKDLGKNNSDYDDRLFDVIEDAAFNSGTLPIEFSDFESVVYEAEKGKWITLFQE